MAKTYVEKPRKVHAEQFTAAVVPWSVHVCTAAAPIGICADTPLYADFRPHVHGDGVLYELHDTDWITTSVAFPDHLPEVLNDAQFVELFGNQPGAEILQPT